MPRVSLRFEFRIPLGVPAAAAYAWCTDFAPSDGALFSGGGRRRVLRLADGALVLTDTTFPDGRRRTIRRLVHLDPTHRAWTNTHLTGPFRHSQYWYRVVPDGPRRSHLEFRGFRIVTTPRPLSAAEERDATRAERAGDRAHWRERLVPALRREHLGPGGGAAGASRTRRRRRAA